MSISDNNIIVKTECDLDFITNFSGEENSQNSTTSNSQQFAFGVNRNLRNIDKFNIAKSVQQQQQQQQQAQQLQPNTADAEESDDTKLQKLLKDFDLEILYNTFKLTHITYRSLKYLSVVDIHAVIPSIPYRAEFREKLFAWRRDKLCYNDTSVIPPSSDNTVATAIINTNNITTCTQRGGGAAMLSVSKPATTAIVAQTVPISHIQSLTKTSTSTSNNATVTSTTTAAAAAACEKRILVPAAPPATTSTQIKQQNIQHKTSDSFLNILPSVSGAATRLTNASTAIVFEPTTMDFEEALSFMPTTSKAAAIASATTATASTEAYSLGKVSANKANCSTAQGLVKPMSAANNSIGHLPKGNLIMSCKKVHIQNLLESSHIGRSIKQFYNKNGYLENQQRNEIVRLTIEEVMQQGESLSPKDFRAIMSDIIILFPNEKAAADYYFIYRSGKGNPLGRLYQRYSNENSKRRKLTRLAEEEDGSDVDHHSGIMDDDDTMSAYPQEVPGMVPMIDEMTALALKQLLTTDHFNWEEVCDKWIQTWALRHKELQQSGLAELISNWPKLSDPRAAELFKIDFRHVFVNKENLLFAKWNDFVKKITPQYDKKLHNEDVKKLYKFCKMGMASKDEKDFIYAIGLTALLPSTGRFKDNSGKLRIRSTISDSIDSFVMRLKTLDAYESHLELYNRKYGTINRTTHPFLVVISPNDFVISKIYVALENRFYCMQSFIQALDLCFKIYHTCGLKYPTMCENVWTFLQRYFYDMTVPWEARNANLVALIVSLNVQN